MQCPNCQKEYQDGTTCPVCNVDSVLFNGTARLSDKLYNKGLTKLNNGDLTQGIELLTRSVSVNKNNAQSRNLLGLALFEIGYVGDAFKHWTISQSLEEKDNMASYYVEEAKKNGRALESLNDATIKYNQALNYLKQKSDDLAIIQLKRAVELNPRFVDALNLLTLCHLIQNDKEKATAAAERVLAVDVQNTIALNYLSVINPNRGKQDTRKFTARRETGRKETTGVYKPVAVQSNTPRTFRFDIILALVIGAALALAAGYVLLVPAITRQSDNQVQQYHTRTLDAQQALETERQLHAEEMSQMYDNLQELRGNLDASDAMFDLQERKFRFMQADNHFRDGDMLDAVNMLDDIDISDFPQDLAERAEHIVYVAHPQLRAHYLAEGNRAFTAGDHYKALVDYEMVLRFVGDTQHTSTFLLNLGYLYSLDEARHAEARELLTEVHERFPNYRPITRNNALGRLTDLD